ncbi:MAG: hypothetical protein IKM95_06410 [Bacteroidales bacterium]|nr:hypothetical protein [Bacteroidales bacterium]
MKKHLFFAIALPLAMTLSSCGNNSPKEKKTDTGNAEPAATEVVETPEPEEAKEPGFPWNYPEGIKNGNLEEGQYVLSIHSFYPSKLIESENPANETYIFYSATLSTVGDTKSSVKYFGDDIEMPNSLIIPIPKEQTAKKGDIVLTWWQSGSGLQRAIVTDASNPTMPKVNYLDLSYKDDGTGFANDHANEQLKPNSFVVLNNGEWQPGAQIITSSNEAGTLISCTDDKVLVSGFAGKIAVYRRSDCKVIPSNQNLKAGDEVMAIFTSSYNTGYTVKKVDQKIGRVWVEKNGDVKVLSLLEVYKP